MTEYVDKVGGKAKDLLDSLQAKLDSAKSYVESAKGTTRRWKNNINDYIKLKENELKELEKKQKQANHDRCYKECKACK